MSQYTDDAAVVIDWMHEVLRGKKPEVSLDRINRFVTAHESRRSALDAVGKAVWLFAGIPILIVVAILGMQIFDWLKFGAWRRYPLSNAFEVPTTGWLGVDQIIAAAFDYHITLPVIVITGIAASIVVAILKATFFEAFLGIDQRLQGMNRPLQNLVLYAANR